KNKSGIFHRQWYSNSNKIKLNKISCDDNYSVVCFVKVDGVVSYKEVPCTKFFGTIMPDGRATVIAVGPLPTEVFLVTDNDEINPILSAPASLGLLGKFKGLTKENVQCFVTRDSLFGKSYAKPFVKLVDYENIE